MNQDAVNVHTRVTWLSWTLFSLLIGRDRCRAICVAGLRESSCAMPKTPRQPFGCVSSHATLMAKHDPILISSKVMTENAYGRTWVTGCEWDERVAACTEQ
jgi:hypothetical protein